MQVSILLQAKGSKVVTVRSTAQVADVVGVLDQHRIGAVVVADGGELLGVLSERDVVRALANRGAAVLDEPTHALMTTEVVTCQPDTTLDELMSTMTERRIRHVPVVVDGSLVGIVSIGDVVKHQIAELVRESEAIHDYIANPY